MKDQSPRRNRPWPLAAPLPGDPKKRKWVRIARIAAYVALAAALITPVVQFQTQTHRNLHRQTGKEHKGAVGRWRKAVGPFWAGRNIYLQQEDLPDSADGNRVWLHPNMPFVVILLTPFAALPVEAMALAWNVLKLLVLIGTLPMLARVVAHEDFRLPDWVLGLALVCSGPLIIGDILHGNTNVFVLGAIVLHLWLFRNGRDLGAGVALALAICLKMTPAIFLLYWLYQRNWRLLAGSAAALILFAVIIPAVAVGPGHYVELMGSWLDNLIVPGLVKGAWYPAHINQSLSGVLSRHFLRGPNGNIFWNPDDNPYAAQDKFRWISWVSLSPTTVRWLLRAGQAVVVALVAWAIGWRKLPRDDGRRTLHYGMVVCALLILNQRTWDHHAGVLLVATASIWYAVAFGRFSRAIRAWALVLILSAGIALLASRSGSLETIGKLSGRGRDAAKEFSDVVSAYGGSFCHFVLVLATGVLLSVRLRRSEPAYAEQRQKLLS